MSVLDQAICYDKIIYNNTVYKTDHILTTSFDNNTRILVYNLKKIICVDDKIIFLCETLNVLSYNKHFISYVISNIDVDILYVLKNINNFMGPPIHLYNLNNITVIRLKHFFLIKLLSYLLIF